MNISEYINILQSLQAEHGDVPVVALNRFDEYSVSEPEIDVVDSYTKGDFEIGQKVVAV